MSPRIAFVVGHAQWGKSRTLRALTAENIHFRLWRINRARVRIRRMSNDDLPQEWESFMNKLTPQREAAVLAAMCPKIGAPDASARKILDGLRQRGYELFFWVLRHQYNGRGRIDDGCIAGLRALGHTVVYEDREEADIRAQRLLTFLQKSVFP